MKNVNILLYYFAIMILLSVGVSAQSSSSTVSSSTESSSTIQSNSGISTTTISATTISATTISATTLSPILTCAESNSIIADINKLSGIWYEVARNPAPTESFLCVQVNFTVISSDVMNVAVTYSNTPTYPWVNQTMSANITLDNTLNSKGYNITFQEPNEPSTSPTIYKLLDTDYSDYAFICGFKNSSTSTDFAVVLTRLQIPNATVLTNYESFAAEHFELFDDSMPQITQSASCYSNGSISLRPKYLFALFVAFCAVMKTTFY